MTNVSATTEKISIRSRLFEIGVETLEKQGWKVERVPRLGKSSVRRITKGKEVKKVAIRTSQDTWIAFPRNAKDDGWATLEEVDYVVAASVDDRHDPQFAQIHMVPGGEMRKRFDRAYTARRKANHVMPAGRGVWLSLYENEAPLPVSLVGGGIGIAFPAIAKVPLSGQEVAALADESEAEPQPGGPEVPFTIAEAKRRLASSLGVSEADIKITISS